MNNTNWLICVGICLILLCQIMIHLDNNNISDHEFIQEYSQRYMEHNPYVLDVHDCVHISDELNLRYEELGFHVFEITSNNGTQGHRRIAFEVEPQPGEFRDYSDQYPLELEMKE